jgi:hypothetical protein
MPSYYKALGKAAGAITKAAEGVESIHQGSEGAEGLRQMNSSALQGIDTRRAAMAQKISDLKARIDSLNGCGPKIQMP